MRVDRIELQVGRPNEAMWLALSLDGQKILDYEEWAGRGKVDLYGLAAGAIVPLWQGPLVAAMATVTAFDVSHPGHKLRFISGGKAYVFDIPQNAPPVGGTSTYDIELASLPSSGGLIRWLFAGAVLGTIAAVAVASRRRR